MDEGCEKFQKRIYVQCLAIILEKLQIPFEWHDPDHLEFNLHVIRDIHVNTTEMSVKDVDNIIKLVLTR